MTNPIVMLSLTISFWLLLTIGAWWQGGSWFPFTVLAPLALIGIALLINKIVPGWGNALVSVLHVVLWIVLIIACIVDWMRSRKKQAVQSKKTSDDKAI